MMKLDSMIYMCVFNAAINSFCVQTIVNKSPTMNSNFLLAINLQNAAKIMCGVSHQAVYS